MPSFADRSPIIMLSSLLSENTERVNAFSSKVLEMKLTVEGLEKERDFYFGQFERKQILASFIYHSNK